MTTTAQFEQVVLNTLACSGGEDGTPLNEVQLAPDGVVRSKAGTFVVDDESERCVQAAHAEHGVDLPIDYPYHLLMLRNYSRGYDVDELITKVKLTADSDKYIAYERYTKQLDAEMAQLFGNVVVWKKFSAAHGTTVWFEVNKEPQLHLMPTVVNRALGYGWCWSGNASILFGDTAAGTVSTAERIDGLIEGHALHHTLPLPFGVMEDPDTWFDPTGYKKLELVCTQGGAAGALACVAEQVRPN